VWFWVLIKGVKLCYLVMNLIKHFWYLIHVEQQKPEIPEYQKHQIYHSTRIPETSNIPQHQNTRNIKYTISPDVTDDAIENDWTKLVSAIFRQFSNCFGLLDFWYCMISTIHELITIYGIWNRPMTLHAHGVICDIRAYTVTVSFCCSTCIRYQKCFIRFMTK
jgi:hypothetical protein